MFGSILSLFLFRYAETSRPPAEVQRIVIAVSSCDMKSGQKFDEACVEQRDIDAKLTPPEVLLFKNVPLFKDKTLAVDIPVGHAFREVDLK